VKAHAILIKTTEIVEVEWMWHLETWEWWLLVREAILLQHWWIDLKLILLLLLKPWSIWILVLICIMVINSSCS